MTLPAWLKDRVGGPTRRGVSSRRCKSCKASILTGLDGDQCAFQAQVDPTPLTALGEALALLAGRRTYELRSYTGGYALHRRDRWQITGRVAGEKHLVVADHACNSTPLPHIIIHVPAKPKKGRNNDIPPF